MKNSLKTSCFHLHIYSRVFFLVFYFYFQKDYDGHVTCGGGNTLMA